MKRMMDPMMMMGRRGKEMMYGKGKEKGAKKLMKKLMEMGITPAAKMGNGEKLLQKSMGMGGPLDMTVMAENSMRYGGATTYSGPSKSKKAKKAKKGRKR
tara:strand:- start:252 stop:551 length:300 start_codon:yes stop_codon:yes gene_type:complete